MSERMFCEQKKREVESERYAISSSLASEPESSTLLGEGNFQVVAVSLAKK